MSFPDQHVTNANALVWSYALPENLLSYETYNLFYGNVEKIRSLVGLVFSRKVAMHWDDLKAEIEFAGMKTTLFLRIIQEMIEHDEPVRSRFGFICYVRERSNVFFLVNQEGAPLSSPTPDLSLYVAHPFAVRTRSLETLDAISSLARDLPKVQAFTWACQSPTSEQIRDLSGFTQAVLLEAAFAFFCKARSKGSTVPPFVKAFLTDVTSQIYLMIDGVFVHTLYADLHSGSTGSEYSSGSLSLVPTGRLRVYPSKEEGWGFVDSTQEKRYGEQIRTQRQKARNTPGDNAQMMAILEKGCVSILEGEDGKAPSGDLPPVPPKNPDGPYTRPSGAAFDLCNLCDLVSPGNALYKDLELSFQIVEKAVFAAGRAELNRKKQDYRHRDKQFSTDISRLTDVYRVFPAGSNAPRSFAWPTCWFADRYVQFFLNVLRACYATLLFLAPLSV